MKEGIRKVEVETGDDNSFKRVRILFGPYYSLEIRNKRKSLDFVLAATHHGFKADASEVSGELEKFINEIRKLHPSNAIH
jgi:hypothetical protein